MAEPAILRSEAAKDPRCKDSGFTETEAGIPACKKEAFYVNMEYQRPQGIDA